MGSGITEQVWTGIDVHREKYLRTGGIEGHIDSALMSEPYFAMNCLIRCKGRKTGRTYIHPLSYGVIAGEVIIVASKGGSDEHPGWYLNLRETPHVEFQVGPQAFRATWREPQGAERDRAWAYMAEYYPFYEGCHRRTKRVIPIVMMKAFEPIPVFQLSDLN
jgi:deazaflavin-dependent oxidoreductase (nitroreductase family)